MVSCRKPNLNAGEGKEMGRKGGVASTVHMQAAEGSMVQEAKSGDGGLDYRRRCIV